MQQHTNIIVPNFAHLFSKYLSTKRLLFLKLLYIYKNWQNAKL